MKISINKDDDRPAYRQIADRVIKEIDAGRLKGGEPLPTERALSEATGLARGTIKRAYDILAAEGRVMRKQGAGTFISKDQASSQGFKARRSARLATQLVDELESLSLTPGEIEAFIGMEIRRRKELTRREQVAVIDCNYETLRVIVNQLHQFPGLEVVEFLVSEVEKFPEKLSYGFELVLTTPTHYDQVLKAAPYVTDRTLKVVISPSVGSVLNLNKIKPGSSVGIWHVSLEFAGIFRCDLAALGKNVSISHRLDTESLPLKDFLRGKDALVVPADYLSEAAPGDARLIEEFREKGGLVLDYRYLIDKGSLVYLREELRKRWKTKDAGRRRRAGPGPNAEKP